MVVADTLNIGVILLGSGVITFALAFPFGAATRSLSNRFNVPPEDFNAIHDGMMRFIFGWAMCSVSLGLLLALGPTIFAGKTAGALDRPFHPDAPPIVTPER